MGMARWLVPALSVGVCCCQMEVPYALIQALAEVAKAYGPVEFDLEVCMESVLRGGPATSWAAISSLGQLLIANAIRECDSDAWQLLEEGEDAVDELLGPVFDDWEGGGVYSTALFSDGEGGVSGEGNVTFAMHYPTGIFSDVALQFDIGSQRQRELSQCMTTVYSGQTLAAQTQVRRAALCPEMKTSAAIACLRNQGRGVALTLLGWAGGHAEERPWGLQAERRDHRPRDARHPAACG